jgi:hypothetical protein
LELVGLVQQQIRDGLLILLVLEIFHLLRRGSWLSSFAERVQASIVAEELIELQYPKFTRCLRILPTFLNGGRDTALRVDCEGTLTTDPQVLVIFRV